MAHFPTAPRHVVGARVLTAVVVTLEVGGVAGGTVAWLLRLLARATGSAPDAGTAVTFLTTMTFFGALLPGAVATALQRRRTARGLLVAGGVAVAGLLVGRLVGLLGLDRLATASAPAAGVLVVLVVALAGVVAGAVWATAWLTRSAVGPGGSGLAGPRRPAGVDRRATPGGGGSR